MSWPTATLGEICDIVSGATPKSGRPEFWDGDVAWVTPKDLSVISGKHLEDTPRKITEAGFKSCSARMLPINSLLFSSRAPIGHVAINRLPVCTNQGFKSLVPRNGKVDVEYLYWWFKAHRAMLEQLGRGATFKEVSKSIVESVAIPVPPIVEQKRIVRILNAVDALHAKRRESIAQLDTLVQSTFLEIFGDPVGNPMGWDESFLLSDIASVTSGITKGRKTKSTELRPVPYLAVANVQENELALDKVKTIEVSEAEVERYALQARDLVLTEGGDPDKLGRGSIWQDELPLCLHQNHIFRVRPDLQLVNEVYLSRLVSSRRGKDYFMRSAKQTTGIASINMTQLKRFPVLLPPLQLQRKFADAVAKIDSVAGGLHAHLAELDTLFTSLQSRAFAGEL